MTSKCITSSTINLFSISVNLWFYNKVYYVFYNKSFFHICESSEAYPPEALLSFFIIIMKTRLILSSSKKFRHLTYVFSIEMLRVWSVILNDRKPHFIKRPTCGRICMITGWRGVLGWPRSFFIADVILDFGLQFRNVTCSCIQCTECNASANESWSDLY